MPKSDLEQIHEFFEDLQKEGLYHYYLLTLDRHAEELGISPVTLAFQLMIEAREHSGLQESFTLLKDVLGRLKKKHKKSYKNAKGAWIN